VGRLVREVRREQVGAAGAGPDGARAEEQLQQARRTRECWCVGQRRESPRKFSWNGIAESCGVASDVFRIAQECGHTFAEYSFAQQYVTQDGLSGPHVVAGNGITGNGITGNFVTGNVVTRNVVTRNVVAEYSVTGRGFSQHGLARCKFGAGDIEQDVIETRRYARWRSACDGEEEQQSAYWVVADAQYRNTQHCGAKDGALSLDTR
jgi:hypothetical protein